MKNIISILLLVLLQTPAFSQPGKQKASLTEEQKLGDSVQFEKFRKANPESFLNKRLPIKLTDGYAVAGYSTGIQIKNNYIADSVYHNFHPGMADTSTLIPFNDIKVTDSKINITLFSHLMLNNGKHNDSASITPIEIEGKWIFNGKSLPIGDFSAKEVAIKISINGKLLFDWKSLENCSKQIYKLSEKYHDFGNGEMKAYSYGYSICDTILNVNDQLLIEIKNTKNNWMIDRYNITRVGAKPFLAKVAAGVKIIYFDPQISNQNYKKFDSIYFGYNGNGIQMTKDSILPASLIFFFFRKPSPDFLDSLQYKFSGESIRDTLWHSTTWYNFGLESESPGGYELSVKYKNSPENVATYRWTVKPKWYETTMFKIICSILILISIISIALIIYKARITKEKEKRIKLNMELRSIQSQLNPHFIFNSLNSIQSLINSNNIIAANEYLSKFSNLMRNVLTDSDKVFQTLNNEIKILDIYLKLEQLRFEFEYSITIDENINKNDIEIPTLLLQPLVENSVKHGVSELREKGKVAIHFYTNNSDLIAEIKDNGKGFTDEKKPDGYGLKLTDDKIQLLNKMIKGQSIQKKIYCKNEETVVQITFKNWL